MPQSSAEQIIERVRLVRFYSSQGLSPLLIRNKLATEHDIHVQIRQIYLDLESIRKGKYEDSWLDDLLDVHYPEIFRQTLSNITEVAKKIKELADLPDTPPRTRIMGLAKIADIEIARINALHRGPVVRELRKVRQRSRKLVEDLAAERAITRKNNDEDAIIEGKRMVLVESDDDPKEEITTPESKIE
jgi:hypothetical protein